jgi:flavin-dependent dehydrogenase
MVDEIAVDVCVIGGGPAGSTLAARLAQLGHAVCLVERAEFPRPHLGESLSPGVLPLLQVSGARDAVERAGFPRVRSVRVDWDRGPEERLDPRALGMLVDRGAFDRLLLEHARSLGVTVLQPAILLQRQDDGDTWQLRGELRGRPLRIRASLLADAAGRAAALPGQRRTSGCRTLGLYCYWRGGRLPLEPRIEAGAAAWYWGVPLPDRSYNTLVFVDGRSLRGMGPAGLAEHFHALLRRSRLMEGCDDSVRPGPVSACDATPYLDSACVTKRCIKVGDAGLALDPLSSSGVQKAIQTALAGAVVVNTTLRRPESAGAARAYYTESLRAASALHCRWAAAHYASAARGHEAQFWQDRAAGAAAEDLPTPAGTASEWDAGPVELSPELDVVDLPCIEGEFVVLRPALRHPRLEEPVAFLGGRAVAPLLRQLRPGMTLPELAQAWAGQVPLPSGLAIAGWMFDLGILVPRCR